MISILIPIYNYNPTTLVQTLHEQANKLNIPYEIVLGNDGSTLFLEELNALQNLSHIRMISVPENTGRAKTRNRLGKEAHYPYLLFIDSDAIVEHEDYLANYLPYCRPMTCVVGGTNFKKETDPAYALNQKYDQERESKNKERQHFTTFQFLIDKNLLEKVPFNENITRYGFEDCLFGYDIANYTPIYYINNPLTHGGLQKTTDYLAKINEAASTLWEIYHSADQQKLLAVSQWAHYYDQAQKWLLKGLLGWVFRHFHGTIEHQLEKDNPSLKLLDFYKLACVCAKK